MKTYIVWFIIVFSKILFGAVLPEHDSSSLKYLVIRRPNGQYEVESLYQTGQKCSVATEKDVNFYFYSQHNPKSPKPFNTTEVASLLDSSYFNLAKHTLFIIHGWHNNYSSPVNHLIKDAVLEKYDVNVFVVDWGSIAEENYFSVYYNVPRIGKFVGRFINDLISIYNYDPFDVKMVGHSLGAHVAGIAGKHTNGTLDYIVGLDPAGPMFLINDTKNRLSKNDARFVQVIHTCTKILGLNHNIGDADYYPNGGTSQTGCTLINDLDGSCSHSRSYEYYAESIRESNGFIATYCDSYKEYEKGNCEHNMRSKMGGYLLDKKAKGKFYLRTKSGEPYAFETTNYRKF